MPLRRRQDLGSHIDDPIFGARDLANSLPKYRFPEHENRPKDIYQVVSDELYLDGNARQNLPTFCQTWEEPEVHRRSCILTAEDRGFTPAGSCVIP